MTEEQSRLSYVWWEKMNPLVRKFVRETVLYGFDEDDLKQECYMQLQKALERYDERLGVPFESYYKITLYGWRSNQNKKSKRRLLEGNEILLEAVDERVDVEKEVEKELLWEVALGELKKLSEVEQYIIKAYYLEGKKLIDIAKALGVNYKTIEFRKGAALKKLRERLS